MLLLMPQQLLALRAAARAANGQRHWCLRRSACLQRSRRWRAWGLLPQRQPLQLRQQAVWHASGRHS